MPVSGRCSHWTLSDGLNDTLLTVLPAVPAPRSRGRDSDWLPTLA